MYYTQNEVCSAHVSVNRNRVKVYKKNSENSVYLKDGQNFEIEIFNPKQNQVLAKISINGKSISSSGIVIRPGQRIYLERFIDESRRFKFSTYEVTDSPQVRRAIENNGEVEIQFYDEWIPSTYWYTSNGQPYQGLNFINTTGNVGIGTSNPSSTLTIGGTTNSSFYSSTNTGVAGSFTTNSSNSIETGRIERGSVSAQHFSTTYGNFNYWASQTERIKIYPASIKPAEINEVRNYCTNCGTRAKKAAWKFCPNCGQKI